MKPDDEALEVRDEGSYQAALATLSRATLPARLLSMLMNSLEGYRQARKIGWSRPWNKYGITTFLALKLRPAETDRELVAGIVPLIEQVWPALDPQAREFIDELLADPAQLGFLFLHESEHAEGACEGFTLSLGRKHQKRYRDRLDLVFELPLGQLECPESLRVALYVDPWRGITPPLAELHLNGNAPAELVALFDQLVALAWQWQDDSERRWDHWTSRYIDYFGPRRQQLKASHLPLAGAARLAPLTSVKACA